MSACPSCGAEVVWATTESGKSMPVDPEPVEGGNLWLRDIGGGLTVRVVGSREGVLRHRPHFATCPKPVRRPK